MDDQWFKNAKCAAWGLDWMFTTGAEQNDSKKVCTGCPVVLECLAEALDDQVEFGVWGGKTERERRAILRRNPNVKNWRKHLEDARDEHERLYAAQEAEQERLLDERRRQALAMIPRQRTVVTETGTMWVSCSGCKKAFKAEQMEQTKYTYNSAGQVNGMWHYRCWARVRDTNSDLTGSSA